jgi:hypothetical protein
MTAEEEKINEMKNINMLNNDQRRKFKERLKIDLDKIKNFPFKNKTNDLSHKPLNQEELEVEVNSKDVDYISYNEKSVSSKKIIKKIKLKKKPPVINTENESEHITMNRTIDTVNEYNYKWAIFTLKILVCLITAVFVITFIVSYL